MKIKFRKRKHENLRKLVKVDASNNVLDPNTSLYVRIEEAEDNVLDTDATVITEELIDNINWKDNNSIVFKTCQEIPKVKEGEVQIICKENGEVWLVSATDENTYKIGGPLDDTYLQINTKVDRDINIEGSNILLGISDQHKIELEQGNIKIILNNKELRLDDTEISLLDHNTYTKVDDTGETYINNGSTFGIKEGAFYIKGMQTQISEDVKKSKVNFLTNYKKAVFGTNKMYVECGNEFIYLKTPTLNVLKVKNTGEIYNSNNMKLIDEGNLDKYISNYLDQNFLEYYIKTREETRGNKLVYHGSTTEILIRINDGNKYLIGYSDSVDGLISEVELSTRETSYEFTNKNKKYKLEQYYSSGDGDDDFIRITTNGQRAYFRYLIMEV